MTNAELAVWLFEQLRYVAGPGAAVIVGMLISNFAEKTDWWKKKEPLSKQLWSLVAAETLAILAIVGVVVFPTFTPEAQGLIGLVVFTIMTTGAAVLSMEYWHTNVNQVRKQMKEGGVVVELTQAPDPEQPPLLP